MDENFLISFFSNNLTLFFLFIASGIFVWLAIQSRNIRSFQFQISVFIVVWIVGEVFGSLGDIGKIHFFASVNMGLLIHLSAMVFLSLLLFLRFYYSNRSGEKLVDNIRDL